jgi:hypothetical protein
LLKQQLNKKKKQRKIKKKIKSQEIQGVHNDRPDRMPIKISKRRV